MRELRTREAATHEQRDGRRARRPESYGGHYATSFDQRATRVLTRCLVRGGTIGEARTGGTMLAPMRKVSYVRRGGMTPGGMQPRDT